MLGVVRNFFLCSRLDPDSTLESNADLLMTPIRELLPGKQVAVLFDGTMYVSDQRWKPSLRPSATSTGPRKVIFKIVCLVALPLAVIGCLIKLSCLRDRAFRDFYAQRIPAHSTCHKKLAEIFQYIHYTGDFVVNDTSCGGRLVFKPLALSECSCFETSAFHRFKSFRRNNLEDAIVQRLNETKPNKTDPIHLLSMGSGGLMSDFLTLSRLVLAGFTNISIDCVDPVEIDPGRVERIREFFANYPAVNIQIQAHKTIDAVPTDRPEYSAVLAIDYEGLYSFTGAGDLMKAYRRLRTDGCMALGYSDEDTLSGPGTPPVYLYGGSSFIFNLAEDMIQHLPQQDALTIWIPACTSALGCPSEHLFFALSIAARKSGKNYQKISVSALSQEGENRKADFEKMVSSFFPEATVQISCTEAPRAEAQNERCDVLFIGPEGTVFGTLGVRNALPSSDLTYILGIDGDIVRVTDGTTNQPAQVKPLGHLRRGCAHQIQYPPNSLGLEGQELTEDWSGYSSRRAQESN